MFNVVSLAISKYSKRLYLLTHPLSYIFVLRQLYKTSWQIRLNACLTQLQQWNNREENEDTNCLCNSKVRKIRKAEGSKDQQEDTLTNLDENNDQDEPIDHENDKNVAGNGEKVDKEISESSHLIVDKGALLHKVFWFKKTFGDTING